MAVKTWLRNPLIRGTIASLAGVLFVILVWRLLGRPVSWDSVAIAPLPLGMAVGGAAAFLGARAWRFRLLLPEQGRHARTLAGVTGLGWGAGLLLPGPSGDVAFVAAARRFLGVSIAHGSGVAVLARILDLSSIALVAALSAYVSATTESRSVLVLSGLIAVGGVALLAVLLLRRPRQALLRLAARVPRLRGVSGRAEAGIAELSSGRVAVGLAATTALCRLATAVQYAGLMSMVGLHLGFWQTWFALSIRTLLFTVPVQGIAGIGTSQAWWTSALALEGIPLGPAIAASVTLQVLDLAVSLPVAGLASLLTLGARFASPERKVGAAPSEVRVPAGSVVATAAPAPQQIDGP